MGLTKVAVVGAGVIGLSTAVNIIENIPNVEVTIIADRFSPNTTGDGAAGIIEPFVSGGRNVLKWTKVTFDHVKTLVQSELAGRLGAQLCSGYHLGLGNVSWSDIVLGFRPLTKEEVGLFAYTGVRHGSFFTTLTLECSLYLPWLMLRFKEKGGKILHLKVNSLDEISDGYDLIVNCCGLSASWMVNDDQVTPVRGQVIKVHAPWIKHFVLSDEGYGPEELAYIIPGAKAVTVGGTTQKGNWNDKIDGEDKRAIWKRCVELLPSLKDAKILYDWTGLRPFRDEVRLEMEEITTTKGKPIPVIHNYGHGGSGVTLHWGCALDATKLVRQAIQRYSIGQPSTPTSKL